VRGLGGKSFKRFRQDWHGTLSDYVSAITWSPTGQFFAASSVAGEVVLCYSPSGNLVTLHEPTDKSVDCLAFSHDGQFLASSGQDGKVNIWRADQLITTLENAPAWVDKLAWNPTNYLLAFSIGRSVQVWDVINTKSAIVLNFDTSSVLSIDWRDDGQHLAIGGFQELKIWNSQNWNLEPDIIKIPSASLALAWSPDGKYLASGNMDRTITVFEWKSPDPWVMHGFPGKIRHLCWSTAKTKLGVCLLACASEQSIFVWEKHSDESVGWKDRVLTSHIDIVEAIAFRANSFLLGSAGSDGSLCLWQSSKQLSQVLQGAPNGFSQLAWHPQGNQIAAGGQHGELLVWSQGTAGEGFSRL
jgi:hypothetical protein